MLAADFNSIAQTLSTGIVNSLVEGTAIAALAALVLTLTKGQSAGVRFAMRFCALVAIALPLAEAAWRTETGSRSLESHSTLAIPGSWATYLFAAWAVIAGMALMRVAVGIWQLHALRKTCVPVEVELNNSELLQTLEQNRGWRSVSLCTSDRVEVPTAIGLVKPAVVLPQWLIDDLPADELKQIVLHEVAHLRRFDDWTNLAQKIVKAVLFFHPAAWWMEKELSLDREMACDEAVLAETANPRAYAECLAHLAERSFLRRTVVLAQAAVGKIKQTSLRVAKILEGNHSTGPRGWKPAAALVAGFAVVCSIGVAKTPQFVVFENSHSTGTEANAARNLTPSFASETTIPQSLIVQASARATESESSSQFKLNTTAPKPRAIATVAWTNVKQPTAMPRLRSQDSEEQNMTIAAGPNARQQQNLFHQTGLKTGAVEVPAQWFMVVETSEFDSGTVVYRMTLWHIAIPAATPDPDRVPRKQT